MSGNRTFAVAAVGIPEHEQKVLRSIFTLSLRRPRSYILSQPVADQAPDIFLVDGDNQTAVGAWRALCHRDQARATLPTVLVTQANTPLEAPLYLLRRPLLAPRVLSTLDQIADQTPAVPPAVTAWRYKALVVDDSPPMRKQIELELEILGIGADFAESGERAYELLSNDTTYDLIFLDVLMPGVDGYKVCKTIKKDKLHKRTPVIMLTGKGSMFDHVRGKLAGCDTYLTKPVARERFQGVVQQYLPKLFSD
jgi:twitching motility two-component system response regulator PilG